MDKRLRQKVRRDPSDLRDQYYTPTLQPLGHRFYGASYLQGPDNGQDTPWCYLVRDQHQDGSCAGHALAHLIDIQRFKSWDNTTHDQTGVSADMLYTMAQRQEGGQEDAVRETRDRRTPEGLSSLRSVVKAFYHFGVCPEASWPQGSQDCTLNVERAKHAKSTTLGAYYRVRPYLNDYHAALSEADGILVSAELHAGWVDDAVDPRKYLGHAPDQQGVIPRGRPIVNSGHAFIIVGYTDRGFLVLNSWGLNWGGYDGRPGIALWPYEDWAEHVMDAWVLRLGVSAPNAFQHSIGQQGILFDDRTIKSSSSACHQLLGHYAHLDDGKHVDHGSYESSITSVNMTVDQLAKSAVRRPVVMSVTGSLLGMKQAFQVEVKRSQAIKTMGMYPYAVFWCNDFMESSISVLSHLFQEAVEKVGPHSKNLDRVIERTTSGIGRAFWRDLKRSAQIASAHSGGAALRGAVGLSTGKDGHAAHMFDSFAAVENVDLHLVVDGAGALLLGNYLLSLEDAATTSTEKKRRAQLKQNFFDRVVSLNLIAPSIDFADFHKAYGPLIRALAKKGNDRALLWVPSEALEAKLHVGYYSHSILDLVLYSFEGAPRDHSYVGMSRARSKIAEKIAMVGRSPITSLPGLQVRTIEQPDADRQYYLQTDVNLNAECQARILGILADIQKKI
ncbi:C1 family peptidase [Actibacterium lipolyticum]|uniref:Peptidase C1A papain C-terminal domain-containing protein n=1 Tax=Actibacterium lipolyticum TaxID=1524263 RepID=A0A238KQV2_9RHOB|nr:C1 family peptidase [Actibacterium lipolyticum]SMX44416.1 hypothetical protein COL8621_02551 [Actibacterium lipolyticum]